MTMVYPVTSVKMSAEEFLEWEEKQPDKHEFIEGEVFAMVGATRQHAAVTGNIFSWLLQHLRGTRCRVYVADMKLRLEAANAFFYPDVFVTCSEADHQAERYMTEPRLIVEVLSESTEAYDRGNKFEKYRQFPSLVEYVLINPMRRKTEIFRKDGAGKWVLYEFGRNNPVHFASLELTIEGAALYENAD
jgi:Uma2 family endonuclease